MLQRPSQNVWKFTPVSYRSSALWGRCPKRVAVSAILKLHETETMPALLYNAETWTLNKTERNLLEKAEIFALKKMIGLPQTTPTAGIIITLGTQVTSVRIDIKQLLYLHRVLQKDDEYWAKSTLMTIKGYNFGWAKNMGELLQQWELEEDWLTIKEMPFLTWKREVLQAAEKQNKEKIKEACEVKSRGEKKEKSKTKYALELLDKPEYVRKLDKVITQYPSIIYARALIMGRYRMLKCANNFSNGYGSKDCALCKVIDDERHRLNVCPKWEKFNRCNDTVKVAFDDIYSDDVEKCHSVVQSVIAVWDLSNGKNEMRE